MDYTLIREYDSENTDGTINPGGYGVHRTDYVSDIFDPERDFLIYLAM